MSIEALIGELKEALAANTAALTAVAANQERLIAGQAAAIDKIEAPKAKRETKAEKEAREKAEAAAAAPEAAQATQATTTAEPANTASGAADAGNASSDGPTDDQLKATAVAWVGQAGDDATEKQRRANWLQTMARNLIGETDESKMIMLTGPESKLTADHRKKAVFFIKRAHKLKGTEHVNFSAPYDFDEAPDQDEPRVETPAAAEPEFDPLG